MAIEFQCQTCNTRLSVPEEHAGNTGKCPQCGKPVAVPIPDETIPIAVVDEPPSGVNTRSRLPVAAEGEKQFEVAHGKQRITPLTVGQVVRLLQTGRIELADMVTIVSEHSWKRIDEHSDIRPHLLNAGLLVNPGDSGDTDALDWKRKASAAASSEAEEPRNARDGYWGEIHCPDCYGLVSVHAKTCPHCRRRISVTDVDTAIADVKRQDDLALSTGVMPLVVGGCYVISLLIPFAGLLFWISGFDFAMSWNSRSLYLVYKKHGSNCLAVSIVSAAVQYSIWF